MPRSKRLLSLLCALLCCLLLAATGLCAASPAVVPVGDTGALAVHTGGRTLLIGGGDAQRVQNALSEKVDYVVRLCDHAEHSGAADALASAYGVPVFKPGEGLPVGDAVWQRGTLLLTVGETRCAFGADAALADAVSYRCDGTFFPYSATTNELAVNVRQTPSASASRVGRLERGQLLSIVDLALGGDGAYWYAVRLSDGAEGFVRSDLLVPAVGEDAAVAKDAPAKGSYIGNRNSKVFHRPTCWTLPAEKNQVPFDSRDAATDAGYRACKNCKP